MKPGIYPLSFEEYLALDAWGSSSLKAMRRGPPARVQWQRTNPFEDTEDTRRGTAVHCLFLTPKLYAETYAHKPEGMTFASNVGKAWRDDHLGMEILSADEALLVGASVAALNRKAIVASSLEAASHVETSLVWRCPITGELCKARPDWIEGRYIGSLKSSRHAEGKSLAYRAYVEGWMHQLAHERTGAQACGLDVRGGRLAVVTPKAPHYVFPLEVKTDTLDLLEIENIATLKAMRECRETGVWADTPDSWEKVEAPASSLVEFGAMALTGVDDDG